MLTLCVKIIGVIAVLLGIGIYWAEQQLHIGFESLPIPQGTLEKIDLNLNDDVKVQVVRIKSQTDMIEGDLYKPTESPLKNAKGKVPLVIIAHGLGSTREMGLFKFAQKFANAGIAALVFDYRNFGRSGGEERHLISPSKHIEDYEAVVQWAYSRNDIDRDRIGLWGTSYSGGHVLEVAASNPSIKAVVSQIPYTGSVPGESKLDDLKKRGPKVIASTFLAILSSKIRSALDWPQVYVQYYAYKDEGKIAINYWDQFGESPEEWTSKHLRERPNDWRNGARVSSLLEMIPYRPSASVSEISEGTDVLYIYATKDTLCDPKRIKWANDNTRTSSILEIDASHFELYRGEPFEQTSDAQLKHFLKNFRLD